MTLQIGVRSVGGRPVLALDGRLNGSTAPQLERWLAEQPSVPSVWDLSSLDFVSSAGLRVLIVHEKRVRVAGSATILVGVTPTVSDVLRMTGLAEFWTQAPSLESIDQATPPESPPGQGGAEASFSNTMGERFSAVRRPGAEGAIVHWHGGAWRGASLQALGVCFGRGGLGVLRDEAIARPMHFAGLTRTLNIRLGDGESDVLTVANPADTFVRVDDAWSLWGEPGARLRLESGSTVHGLRDAVRMVTDAPWNAALVVVRGEAAAPGAPAPGATLVLVVFPPGEGASWHACHVALADGGPDDHVAASYPALIDALPSCVGEELRDDVPAQLPPGSIAHVWSCAAPGLASERTLRVEVPPDGTGDGDATELIVRALYADCQRVALTRLTGGYSASTWQVESYDALGRRLLPTVLKVGPVAMMRRENDAHERYVRPFILNNASVGLGMTTQGESVGLRYNFLGVTGDGTTLRTLGRRWQEEPAERTHPLYETVVRRTLAPWYGQARVVETALYADHTPLRLFPDLVAAARAALPFDLDQPTLWCDPLACELPNPWWLLIHEFPRRREERRACRVAITHGDLNLNNVLSDDRDNLYVIDFSETRERSVGSDLARLESVFLLLQRPAPGTPDAVARFLGDVQRCYATDAPWHAAPPPCAQIAADDLAFIARLRAVARDFLGADAPAEAYLLPVLEWTLPMAVWPNLSPAVRELSTWVAALQVARIEAARRESPAP